ncbi:MAG: formate/nitrite transporter family protein [Paracoccaceae bacterium]
MISYVDTIHAFAKSAHAKAIHVRKDLVGFLILTAMAGSYVGFGILLIFSVGQGVDASIRPIVMGASFGLALMLVIFAGSELFTGHTMYMTFGALTGRTGLSDLAMCLSASWIGNLIGAAFLGALFVYGGGGLILSGDGANLLHTVAEKKMHASAMILTLNAVLCNWLVCLAIWMSERVTTDIAKIVLIWFCLYAFIAAGFEHSVANMTIFSVALLSEHSRDITFAGAAYNFLFVSIGNTIAGAGIMGVGYWLAAGRPHIADHTRDNS